MLMGSCLKSKEMPGLEDDLVMIGEGEDEEEDVEIELVEEEPAFLRGYGRVREELSPVRIMKNPDGSLAQAAMMQSALSKERRESKMAQKDSEVQSRPATFGPDWNDPIPNTAASQNEDQSRNLSSMPEVPEWKKHITGN